MTIEKTPLDSPSRRVAILIGISNYQNQVPVLKSPIHDVDALARQIHNGHNYRVHLVLDDQATLAGLRTILDSLPKLLNGAERAIFYFAGHGIALDQEAGQDGPAGYLIPQDACRDRPETFLPMQDLRHALDQVSCPHLLIILDCCFAGAFRWSTTRSFRKEHRQTLYRERYERYLRTPSWQVLCSAASDEEALDIAVGGVLRGRSEQDHRSPFSIALCEGLSGKADLRVGDTRGDGIILANELLLYLEEPFRRMEEREGRTVQTPMLWSIAGKDKGQFVFEVPGRSVQLPSAESLTEANNPYRGLSPYEEAQQQLFFGRQRAIHGLVQHVQSQPFTVVVGASGSGKSSLVRAGLIPTLRGSGTNWVILPPMRPGHHPMDSLAALRSFLGGTELDFSTAIDRWCREHSDGKLLLVIDQAEELVTLSGNEAETFQSAIDEMRTKAAEKLHVVYTLRSDFEPHFDHLFRGSEGRARLFRVPQMTREELREVIERPAQERVLYIEPSELVDELIDEVIDTPGALPLLSFTLSEMYRAYVKSQRADRILSREDYVKLGRVDGALRKRADEVFESLVEPADRETLRHLMLRMVVPGELARRRLYKDELLFADPAQNTRCEQVLAKMTAARLVITDADSGGRAYFEPAHDKLLLGWPLLRRFLEQTEGRLPLCQSLTEAVGERAAGRGAWLLWSQDPRLPELLLAQERDPLFFNSPESQFLRVSLLFRRLAMATVLGLVLGLSALTAFALIQRQTAATERDLAKEQKKLADEQKALALDNARESHRRMVEAHGEQGRQYMLSGQPDRALLWLSRAYRESQQSRATSAGRSDSLDGWRYTLREAMRNVDAQRLVFRPPTIPARSVAYRTAAPYGMVLTTGSPTVWLFPKRYDSPRPLVGHKSPVRLGLYSEDGKTVLTQSTDGQIYHWNAETGVRMPAPMSQEPPLREPEPLRTLPKGLRCPGLEATLQTAGLIAWSKSRTWVLIGTHEHAPSLWDVTNCVEKNRLSGPDSKPVAAAFLPDERESAVTVVFEDQSASEFQIPTGRLIRPLMHKTSVLSHVTASPDGDKLLFGTEDGTVTIVKMGTGSIQSRIHGYSGPIAAAAFRSDGMELVVCDEDRNVGVWDPVRGLLLSWFPLDPDQKCEPSLALSDDGQVVRIAPESWRSRDGKPAPKKLVPPFSASPSVSSRWTFRTTNGKTVLTVSTDDPFDVALAFNQEVDPTHRMWLGEQARYLLTWDRKGARVWDTDKAFYRPVLENIKQPADVVMGPTASQAVVLYEGDSTGKQLKSDDKSKLYQLEIRDVETGRLIQSATPARQCDDVGAWQVVTFSSDGQRLAFANPDQSLVIRSAMNGTELARFVPSFRESDRVSPRLSEVRFAPDSKRLVALYNQRYVFLIDERGNKLLDYKEQQDVWHVDLSPDSQRIYTYGNTDTVRFRSAHDGTELPPLNGMGIMSPLNSATFSASGQYFATGSGAGDFRLWDASRGRLLHVFFGHEPDMENAAPELAISPDEHHLTTTGTSDRRILIHDPSTGKLLADLERRREQLGWSMNLVYSRDGNRFLVLGKNPSVSYVYDAKSFVLLRVLGSNSYPVEAAQFAADGAKIVTRDDKNRMRIWASEPENRPAKEIEERLRCRLPLRFADASDEKSAVIPNPPSPECALSVLTN